MPQEQQAAEPLLCRQCQRALRGYYEIKHIKPDGSTSPKQVRVCSVLCLIQWAYSYGVQLGARGLGMVRTAVEHMKGSSR